MSTPHGEPAASSNDPIASGPIPEATSDNSHSSPIAPPEQTHRVPQPLHLQTTTYAHASSLREPSETIVDQSDQQQSDAWFLGFDLALNEDALRSVDRLQSDQAASSAPHLEDWDISFGDDLQFPDLLSSAHTMVTGPFQGVEQSISRQDNGVSRDSGLQIRPLSSPTDELAIRHDERPYYNYHRAPSSSDYGSQLRPNNPHLLSTQTLPNRLISSMSENIHTSPTSNDRVPSSEGHTEGSRLLTATRSQQEQSIHSTHGIEQRPSQPDHSETGISPQVELVLSKNEKSKKPRRRPSKRERSRFSSPKRRQVAERRQQGACDTCRKRKVTVRSSTHSSSYQAMQYANAYPAVSSPFSRRARLPCCWLWKATHRFCSSYSKLHKHTNPTSPASSSCIRHGWWLSSSVPGTSSPGCHHPIPKQSHAFRHDTNSTRSHGAHARGIRLWNQRSSTL